MKTLILYASRHGCAEKCATELGKQLKGDVTALSIKNAGKIDLADFGTVIVGGSIHAGKIQGAVRRFCEDKTEALKSKRLGLFLCCMAEGPKAEEQFTASFPPELIGAAAAKGLFGGEFDFDRMNWLEKKIVKKVAKIDSSVTKIKEDNIREFARVLNETSA